MMERSIVPLLACASLAISAGGLVFYMVRHETRLRERAKAVLDQRSDWTREQLIDHFEGLGIEKRVAEGTCTYLQGRMPIQCFPFLPTDQLNDVNGINVLRGESTFEIIDDTLILCETKFRGSDVQDLSDVEQVVTVEDFVLWMDKKIRELEATEIGT